MRDHVKKRLRFSLSSVAEIVAQRSPPTDCLLSRNLMRTKLSVFGLGYVGSVTAACFAREGHDVIGVDLNETKVNAVNSGHSPIAEAGLDHLIRDGVTQHKLRATVDADEAVNGSELSFICVGTPSAQNGDLDLNYVKRVSAEIGRALRRKREPHIVVVRSTMLPGTLETIVIPILEQSSGRKAGSDFGVCVNPEFLREGVSVEDFYSPPFTLIGSHDRTAAAAVHGLYAGIDAPILTVPPNTAEMVKCISNGFHAVKINFANEIGNICNELGMNSHEVMEVFCLDKKLNLSSRYLTPGFAFGGSCLPKDVRALTFKAEQLGVEVPMLSAVIHSNCNQIDRAVWMVMRTGKTRVGLFGLSFKCGTDDMRESPLVTLMQKLVSKGLEVVVCDPDVSVPRLVGANKEYIEHALPNIAQLLRSSIDAVLADAEVVVVGKEMDQFREIESKVREDQIIINLVYLFGKDQQTHRSASAVM